MKNIRSFLITFFTTLLIASPSYATGFYLGVDGLYALASHKAKNQTAIFSGPNNGSIKDDENFNYGVNAGFRLDILNLLAEVELFYDDIRTSASNFEATNGAAANPNDSNEIKDRYGVKANAGFAIAPGFTPFLTYGLTRVNYESNIWSQNVTVDKSKPTPIYGVGFLLDLPLDISVRTTYDYQHFNMNYASPSASIRTHLSTIKLGLRYNF